jgi:hypothetical protein
LSLRAFVQLLNETLTDLQSSLGSLALYLTIFLRLQFRLKPTSVIGESSPAMSFNSDLGKNIDRIARRMLLFPAMYLFNTLFLSIYRLSTYNEMQEYHLTFPGHWKVLTAASCLFALSGVSRATCKEC